MQFRHFHFLGCEAAALTRAFFLLLPITPQEHLATSFWGFFFLSKLLSLSEMLVEGPIWSIIFLAKKWFLKDYPWPDRVLVIKSDKKTLWCAGFNAGSRLATASYLRVAQDLSCLASIQLASLQLLQLV